MDHSNSYQSPPESTDKALNHHPSSKEPSTQYASRWLRLAAVILDCIILGPLNFTIAYCIGIHDITTDLGGGADLEIICLSLLGIAIFILINGWPIYTRGQTIGKMICGTVVVTKEFRRVSGNRYIFLRLLPVWIIVDVPFVGGFFAIFDILAIFRPEKNCIHDDIAGTRVIMRRDLVKSGTVRRDAP